MIPEDGPKTTNVLQLPTPGQPPKSLGTNVDNTLAERGKRYGPFNGHAAITYSIKRVMRMTAGWERLNDSQCEALDMIAHKIGRILNGDPNYTDSWHDIAGYAKLVEDELNGVVR